MSVGSSVAQPINTWQSIARELGPRFAERAAKHDAEDSFVAENYEDLKQKKVFSAGVPAELGGGGATHAELCDLLRELGRSCGSTALALSMHTHLLATTVWRYKQGHPVEPLLRRVADQQIVLVSTGASDWLESSGRAERVDGGFKVTARKIFGSGSPSGTLLMTSAPWDDPENGATVLHFPVSMTAEGVTVLDNWRSMGMRATGSNDVLLDGVFVPEASVSMRRPKGAWHPFFVVVSAVALPLVMSVYLGIAEAAEKLAREIAARRRDEPHVFYLIGEMENALATAQMAVREMVEIAANYTFEVSNATANAIAIRKTIAAKAGFETAEKAMQVAGGSSFYRSTGIERLVRDLHGAQFHPLQEKRQLLFTGRVSLGLDPVA